MPVMDGLEDIRALRQQSGAGATCPSSQVTASSSSDARAKAREAGMNDCISRPIDVHALLTTLARRQETRP